MSYSTSMSKSNVAAHITWFLTSFFYAFQMALRVLPGIMMDDIMSNFNMTIGQFGLLAGFYYLGYAGAQIPLGLLLDKFHPRYVLAICISLCSLGLVCFSSFNTPFFAYIGRLLIGIGSVAGILGSVKVINEFFPNKYSFMLGFTVLIGVSGAFYGGAPISYMLKSYSAVKVLNYLAILGLIIALIIMVFYTSQNSKNININKLDITSSLKLCLNNKQLWAIGIYAGLMVGPLEGFADIWGMKYYTQAHGLSPAEAGIALSLIFLGMGIGGPIMGYLASRGFNEVNMVIICGLLLCICFLILFFTPFTHPYIIYIISLLIGLLSAYQVVVFSIVSKINSNNLVGLMSSLLNMLIMSFGFIFHFAIGSIFENWFTPITETGNYSIIAYNSAFSVIVLGLIIGSFGFIKLKKTLNYVI
ncbi:MAG: Arabinose efflux permease [Rickettsiaceae bacterium]|nr:Arabinose efflux permease [Rickettsiaceae bacterium]